jgi:hypothetical protein
MARGRGIVCMGGGSQGRRCVSAQDRADYGKRHLDKEGAIGGGRRRRKGGRLVVSMAVFTGGIGCPEHVQHGSTYGAGLHMLFGELARADDMARTGG